MKLIFLITNCLKINQKFFNDFTEAPETLVSILRCLGETMTVHVACTIWDKQFRLALVASSLPIDYKFESPEFYSTKSQVKSLH